MPSVINSDDGVSSGTAGLKTSGSNDGITVFQQNGTESARITAAGNVGIGTSSPGTKLEINTGSSYAGVRLKGTSSASTGFEMTLGSNGKTGYLWNYENDALLFATNNTERARIDSSGNVGIGTSSPVGKVESKTATVAGGSADYAQKAFVANIPYSTTNVISSLLSGWDGSSIHGVDVGYTYNGTGYSLIFSTNDNTSGNPIERARITSSGRLLINTTTADTNYYVRIEGNAASSSPLRCSMDSTSSLTQVGFFNPNGAVGSISTSGTSTSYNTSSDYRLKHDIAPMTGALAKVAALKPCTYKWNTDNSAGEGFIAHELAEVCPQAVTGEKDEVDAEGKPKYQGVDTSFLVATLTAAIQELKAELDATKAEVAALKARTT